MKTAPPVPHIIDRAGDLLSRYEALFCDVWGVVHDGHRAFAAACTALDRFRANGGTVILVSNAPVPEARVMQMLDERAVPREAYDRIVTSGDIALARIASQGYQRVHCIGPRDRDAAFFEKVTAAEAAIDTAQAIVCTGLDDDENETAGTYRPLLERALARSLPFVCANPDFVVDVGGKHYLCAGAIADLYAHMGGAVFWAGKPHPSAYSAALAIAESLRGETIARSRLLVIGDSVRTDIRGAQDFGIDALFVASGIHHHEVIRAGRIDPAKLAQLFTPSAPSAIAAMTQLQ